MFYAKVIKSAKYANVYVIFYAVLSCNVHFWYGAGGVCRAIMFPSVNPKAVFGVPKGNLLQAERLHIGT